MVLTCCYIGSKSLKDDNQNCRIFETAVYWHDGRIDHVSRKYATSDWSTSNYLNDLNDYGRYGIDKAKKEKQKKK